MTKEEINKKIEEERKWLMCAGFNAYNVDIVLDTIKQEIKGITLEPCEDAVSRKAVLNLAKDLEFKGVKGLEHYKHKCIEIEDVENLPSVTPELSSLREMNDALKKRVQFLENMIRYASAPTKKVGKWEYDAYKDKSGGHCNQCGHFLRYGEKTNFCPDCGAEMESKND